MTHFGNLAIYLLLFAILLQFRGLLDNFAFLGLSGLSALAMILSFDERKK